MTSASRRASNFRRASILMLLVSLFAQTLFAQTQIDEREKHRRLKDLVDAVLRNAEGAEEPRARRPSEPRPSNAPRAGSRRKGALAGKRKDRQAGVREPAPQPSPVTVAPPRPEPTPGAQLAALAETRSPSLIEAPAPAISRRRLFGIFASLLALLGLASLGPAGVRMIERWKQRRALGQALVTLTTDSPLIGEKCPNEGGNLGGSRLFKPGDLALICPGCGTAHHLGCWRLSHDRCWNRQCDQELPVPDATERNP